MKTGKELLERILSSAAKGEMLTLFHKNPGLVDTMDGIGRRIGMTRDDIEADVNDFLEIGLLKDTKVGKISLYSFNADKDREIQESLAEYARSLKR